MSCKSCGRLAQMMDHHVTQCLRESPLGTEEQHLAVAVLNAVEEFCHAAMQDEQKSSDGGSHVTNTEKLAKVAEMRLRNWQAEVAWGAFDRAKTRQDVFESRADALEARLRDIYDMAPHLSVNSTEWDRFSEWYQRTEKILLDLDYERMDWDYD